MIDPELTRKVWEFVTRLPDFCCGLWIGFGLGGAFWVYAVLTAQDGPKGE